MLTQRLRWAQGTIQVMLRENPLAQRGLKWGQRLMYFAAPLVYLLLGILPVSSLSADFFIRFIPFMIVNQLLFAVAGRGIPTSRCSPSGSRPARRRPATSGSAARWGLRSPPRTARPAAQAGA
jgi:cellulose synthase/poly-beta-1,6-N-acetylglucosamine synthase-like glycosyltransferase